MSIRVIVYLQILIFCPIVLISQTMFECNGKILISTNNDQATHLYQLETIPFSPPFLSLLTSYEGNYDGLGYNFADNFIYCVAQNTNDIIRLGQNGRYQNIGQLSLIDTLKVEAGDCTVEGLYVIYDYGIHKILILDVINGLRLVKQVDLFWDPTSENQGPFKTRIFDLSIDPNDPNKAYAYQGIFAGLGPSSTAGAILKINLDLNDPALGKVTPLSKLSPENIAHITGLTFNSNSQLFGFGSSGQNLNPPQDKMISIDVFQGQNFPVLSDFIRAKMSDGCSCPYSLSFTNAVPFEGMFCNNDTKNFVVGFENNSYFPLQNIALKDTLPEGTIIKSISNTFQGTIDIGTGVGTNILSISNLVIPAKGSFKIVVEVLSVNAKDGPASNRAYLTNLPPRFPEILASDDPNSSASNDRSKFYFETRKIKNLTWSTVPPSDCILANDGKIIVKSNDFIIGQEFELSLRNWKGWAEYIKNCVVDPNHQLVMDSLPPGEYQLFRLRSPNDNCSVSLQDTFIFLDPPNDQLSLTVDSNNPVCEGDTLYLKTNLSPSGEILWRGPDRFGSEDLYVFINNIGPKNEGKYTVTASYGFCSQKEELNLIVKPKIDITIDGKAKYCIRDTLKLIAISKTKDLDLWWYGPMGLASRQSTFSSPVISQEVSGWYTLIADNGSCQDTAKIEILALETPTLVMSDTIETDFCEPIIFNPKIVENYQVNYQWEPAEGLSCDNCVSPQLEPIVNTRYHLKVMNDYGCSDSSSVKIVLDKSKLVHAPNIFFPGGSENNSSFELTPTCIVRYVQNLSIFDRYGNQVFKSESYRPNDPLAYWDGKMNGKDVAQGVYIWIAKLELVDGEIVYQTGNITKI